MSIGPGPSTPIQTRSFQPPRTQPLISFNEPSASWGGPSSVQLGQHHGAISRGRLAMSTRAATELEKRPVQEYYKWWQAHGGMQPPYIVAFVNSTSGNQRVSQAIKKQLEELLGTRFHDSAGTKVYLAGEVCELSEVVNKPTHVRDTIRNAKRLFSSRALRFLVCGGDGTVTWVLQEIEACKGAHPDLFPRNEEEPPIGIVPAGTGNDLARSLGWGALLRRVADLPEYVHWALEANPVLLDQWKVTLRLSRPEDRHMLPAGFQVSDPATNEYVGYFQNYFSVGMDAAVTYGVESARKSCTGGLFFRCGLGKACYGMQAYRSCCARHLSLYGDNISVRKVDTDAEAPLTQMAVGRTRQLTLLNINSYGSGRVPFSNEDLANVSPADGLFEVFAVRDACRLGLLMGSRRFAQLIAKSNRLEYATEGPEYFQMDGEAFYLETGCQVQIERNRRVMMLRPPTCRPGIWKDRMTAGFWGPATRNR